MFEAQSSMKTILSVESRRYIANNIKLPHWISAS